MKNTDNRDAFLSNMKNDIASIINKPRDVLIDWLNSDDGITLQNSLLSLGAITDYAYVGGLIFPFLSQLLDESKRDKFSEHIADIGKKLSKQPNLNQQFMKSDLGRRIFEDTLKTILEEVDREKIEYQKSFLINAFKQLNPNDSLIDTLRRLLLDMDAIHLKIISIVMNPSEHMKKMCINKLDNALEDAGQTTETMLLWEDLNEFYLKQHREVYSKSIKDLKAWNMIKEDPKRNHAEVSVFIDRNDQKSMKQGIDSLSASLNGSLTSLGKTFFNFTTGNW